MNQPHLGPVSEILLSGQHPAHAINRAYVRRLPTMASTKLFEPRQGVALYVPFVQSERELMNISV